MQFRVYHGGVRLISASRRTDIPAFYSRWLLRRLDEGYCHSINPFGGQIRRVPLRAEDTLGIVFWTRSPSPLLPHLGRLRERGYQYYFHFSLNGYPREIETNNPQTATAIRVFRKLSDEISPARVFWRYDPIVLSDRTPPEWHLARFEHLSRELEGFTQRCSFSFVDWYGKTARNLAAAGRAHGIAFVQPEIAVRRELARSLAAIAAARGITLYSCCEDDLVGGGIEKARCVDSALFGYSGRFAPTRADCGCVESTDIGAYDTCVFGCAYCYATNSRKAALARMGSHDPEDTVLWRPATLKGKDLAELEWPATARGAGSDAFRLL